MAPQYAPSLRSRLAPILLFLQTGFIVIYAFCAELEHIDKKDETFSDLYPVFQDVNVAVILGFGFLGTFLVRYGFSSSGFSLLVAVIATQWAVVLNGLQSWSSLRGKFTVGLRSLVVAEICAASALISMGAVLGKTNPVQLLLVALLEVSGFILNGWLLQAFLKLRHLNTMMMLHVFGSFFGLMLTRTLYRKESQHPHEKEKFDRKTGLFSMLGTLFLWMFWPSFNSELVELDRPGGKMAAVCSTYLALAVSALTAAAVSVLTSPEGRLHPGHLQRCTLAGGVAIGVSISVVHLPWVAMAIGFAAAVISTLGFRYLKLHMLLGFECHDTCGVLCTHGLPGLLGWLAHLILQLADSEDLTTAIRFAVFHICTLLITLSLSMTMGILTGLLLKWNFWRPTQNNKCFDDQAFWEFPHLAVQK